MTILHIFRVHRIKDGIESVRGTLTVVQTEDGLKWIYFDSFENGEPKRTVIAHADMACYDTEDDKLVPTELPEAERELGSVRYLVFGLRQGTLGLTLEHLALLPDCFRVYRRLPVPPPGASVRTAVAPVHMNPKVAAR